MMEVEQFRHRFLVRAQAEVSDQNYKSWFKPVSIMQLTEKEVVLGVPDSFHGDWLKSNYSGLIEGICNQLAGRQLSLSFRVLEERRETGAGEAPPPRRESPGLRNGLNAKYTFGTFVVGSCNQFAHAACLAVAERPAQAYNPLFLYGGVGLGKTHLMTAIGHRLVDKNGAMRVCYLSSERFTNELINSIRFDHMPDFRDRYRSCDALLIDDIQFISGKERTQEEFFHTFNTLYECHRQIVVSSDRFPREISGLEERLRSRFEWGLIADIQPPEVETKVAILKKRAETESITVPDEVAFFLATAVQSNIRELEGALTRVAAFSSLTGSPITLELAKEVLKGVIPDPARPISVTHIQKVVANHFKLKVTDLKSPRRCKSISFPRHVAMYLSRLLSGLSFPDIGREFGDKDHSTVIHAVRKIEERAKGNPQFRKELEALTSVVKG